MIDVTQQINSVRPRRQIDRLEVGEARIVTISQTYDTDIDDVWDACTNPERIPPLVHGRLGRPAGGRPLPTREERRAERSRNANRPIVRRNVGVRGEVSQIESPSDGRGRPAGPVSSSCTPPRSRITGPVRTGRGRHRLGPRVIGLALHLDSGGEPVDPAEVEQWVLSEAGREFITRSSEGWRDADIAVGTPRYDATAAAACRHHGGVHGERER